ncbi:MAG: DUF1194 domain-containing protein [Pseudomonadota bacterium]
MRAVLVALALAAPLPAAACAVELVLALDVSRSVDSREYRFQIEGLAEALRDEAVVQAITTLPEGVMATVTQWSGPLSQDQSVGWHHLTQAAAVADFADEVQAMERRYYASYTAIGEALAHAGAVARTNPRVCARRVIDVSGDGVNNRGRPPGPLADALVDEGFTINALVIRWGQRRDRAAYFRRHVARGPGSFVEIADGFEDYERAMKRKLLRELGFQMVRR